MGYEITKFNFKSELASASFNAKFEEIETFLNNISSEVDALREENKQLKQQLNNKVERHILHQLKIKDLNNANFSYNYETDTSEGRQMGLPTDWAFIKFFKHSNNNGYCTQIAYKLASSVETADNADMWMCKMRISDGEIWKPWVEFNTSLSKIQYPINDANKALENGKLYYCEHNKCVNLPYPDDGILQVFSYNNESGNRAVCFQMWYSWNNDCVCYRKNIWGNWSVWKKLAVV